MQEQYLEVFLDEELGHLHTKCYINTEKYYDREYFLYTEDEENDILYAVKDGEKIFRQQHQLNVLLEKINFNKPLRILDYGCAKGTVMKRLRQVYPQTQVYLFDVSQMYIPLWNKFLSEAYYATYQPKPEWSDYFDVVTSFFAFEHITDPKQEFLNVRKLLKDEGIFYCIVPNVHENPCDLIVADHLHHYSSASIKYLLAKTGFRLIEIDTTSHFAAYIIIAQKANKDRLDCNINQDEVKQANISARNTASYWTELQNKIESYERQTEGRATAIYGAGVYGNFIASVLKNKSNLACFIDQNPIIQGKYIQEKQVLSPEQLPNNIQDVYVGLNPKIAKAAIQEIQEWKSKTINFFYL
jgi:SAM-dependent methyltransferase